MLRQLLIVVIMNLFGTVANHTPGCEKQHERLRRKAFHLRALSQKDLEIGSVFKGVCHE